MRYWMYREDGCGDSGPLSEAWIRDHDETTNAGVRPVLGACMRVGSIYARSYSNQDYWTTTPITEIVSETETEVVFKTRSGSTYTWKVI